MNDLPFILILVLIAMSLPIALHKFSEFSTRNAAAIAPSPNSMPDSATSKFYLGNFWYRNNRWLGLSSPIVPLLVVTTLLVLTWRQDGGVSGATLQRLLQAVGIILVITILFWALGFGTEFNTNMYPEFAIAEDRLWYCFFNKWQYLYWDDIQTVTKARSWMGGSLGILIYSAKLPKECGNYARLYGKSSGKALVVFNLLPHISEFETDLLAHIPNHQPATGSQT